MIQNYLLLTKNIFEKGDPLYAFLRNCLGIWVGGYVKSGGKSILYFVFKFTTMVGTTDMSIDDHERVHDIVDAYFEYDDTMLLDQHDDWLANYYFTDKL